MDKTCCFVEFNEDFLYHSIRRHLQSVFVIPSMLCSSLRLSVMYLSVPTLQ